MSERIMMSFRFIFMSSFKGAEKVLLILYHVQQLKEFSTQAVVDRNIGMFSSAGNLFTINKDLT